MWKGGEGLIVLLICEIRACQETWGQRLLWACSREVAGEELISVSCPTPPLLSVPSMSHNLALLSSDHTIYSLNFGTFVARRVLLGMTPGPSQVNQAIPSSSLKTVLSNSS